MWETILGWLNPISWIQKGSIYISRPQLEVYYDPRETYYKARDLGFNAVLGLFCHVMVRNKGKNTAVGCVGELKSIKLLKNDVFQNVSEYRNIMRLKWAHEKDFSSKDIDTDTPRRLDVCYVHKGFDILHFFTEKYPSGNQTDFPPGEYKIRVLPR
ncbi:hypothetical protein HZB78_02340 [Candidatus Collierbacteria bacterium]|nr:hypothetical protein [Candidatus Collierbacteria bacterium]